MCMHVQPPPAGGSTLKAEPSPQAGDVKAFCSGQAIFAMLELAKQQIDLGAPAPGTRGLARSLSAERGQPLVRPIGVMTLLEILHQPLLLLARQLGLRLARQGALR